MTEPKTTEDWQHAAERWEKAAGEWKQAHDTVAASNERLRYDLEREKIDIELVGKDLHRALGIVEDQRQELERIEADLSEDLDEVWDQVEHQRQRADHNDRVATFASRQRDLMAALLTPEQLASLGRMMTEEQA